MNTNYQKIAIAVSLKEELLPSLKRLKELDIVKQAKQVSLIHIFKTEYYTNDFAPYSFPPEEAKPEIEKTVITSLKNIQENYLPPNLSQVQLSCDFSGNPKQTLVDQLQNEKFDLVITATRGKHGIEGLFSSSFSEFLLKFSPCDVLVLRPLSQA